MIIRMLRLQFIVALLFTASTAATAQWTIQESHTTADLRGIDNGGNGIAWASGTNGTVLRTTDGGSTWRPCTTPPGAAALDFRGIQAFDDNTAIVMSSGKGDLSRLYKTTDACKSWKLVFTNPDQEGFWDAVRLSHSSRRYMTGVLIGDPVNDVFSIFVTRNAGDTWTRWNEHDPKHSPKAGPKESLFAASNSAVVVPGDNGGSAFVTGGSGGAHFYFEQHHDPCDCKPWEGFSTIKLPMPSSESAGAFAIARRTDATQRGRWAVSPGSYSPGFVNFVVVGGDYKQPDAPGTSASIRNLAPAIAWLFPRAFKPTTPPHGYRSAVAYDAPTNTWITVGPNGTDISSDDGRSWRSACIPTPR